MAVETGNRLLSLRDDITDTDALRAAIVRAAEAHGPVRVLINNAGNDLRHTAAEVTPDLWDEMMAVNLKALFFAIRDVVPGMREAGGGAIVNVSSISYMMGKDGYPIYASVRLGRNAGGFAGPGTWCLRGALPRQEEARDDRRGVPRPPDRGARFAGPLLVRPAGLQAPVLSAAG
ncbi:MAG: SDR family NAD(P)-dependent oxidoreductase [Roseicyclus sp.]